jgi:hypothetical protein
VAAKVIRPQWPAIMASRRTLRLGDNQYSSATGAVVGLYDKVRGTRNDGGQSTEPSVLRDDFKDDRRGHAEPRAQAVHLQLVVDPGKVTPRIPLKDAASIPLVHAKHAPPMEAPGSVNQPQHLTLQADHRIEAICFEAVTRD